MTITRPDPILEAYVLRVGAALGDVEPTERHALLADLRLHLDEVGHDDERRLDDIVGPPEVYATELRAAAGLAPPAPTLAASTPPAAPGHAGPAWPWVRTHVAVWREAVRRAWTDVWGAVGEACQDGPTWWLLRGLLAVHAIGGITSGWEGSLLLPQVMRSTVGGLAVWFGCTVASVRVGRRPDRVPLRVVRIANVAVVVVGGLTVLDLGGLL